MVSPIAEMAVEKGVANVDFSKLTPALRAKVCDEVGEAQLKRGNHEEAALAFSLSRSPKLRETATYFLRSGLPGVAAAYAFYVGDTAFMEEVAFTSLNTGAKEAAKRLFRRAGNEPMVRFIEENL